MFHFTETYAMYRLFIHGLIYYQQKLDSNKQ